VATLALLVACSPDGPAPKIEVLSAKAHLVSGYDALVRITSESGGGVAVELNGKDISEMFREESGGMSWLGLVYGLRDGRNMRTAGGTAIEITNYPITGPMISGPHEQPFVCQTEEFATVTGEMLGAPLDENCSIETRIDYVYLSTSGRFKPWSDGSRPVDLAETTTSTGQTVPFIVRVQTGTVNRAVYESAVLHDPAEPPPDPWTRSAGWNGKLIYTHGGGCQGGWHHQGDRTGGVLREGLLKEGYAITSASLNVFGVNCNDLLASETHMMVKERFIESHGEPLFTIATGGSGGSYQSHQTADNYPGIFDGIIVTASFPDVTSATIFTVADARLLHFYFSETAPSLFTKDQQRAVSGFSMWENLPRLSGSAARIDPVFEKDVPASEQGGAVKVELLEPLRYHPTTNPSGLRPTVYEHTKKAYGIDPATGFALRPLDNVGVEYGLAAFNAGTITAAQFLDLNERVSGLDVDGQHSLERHAADPAAAKVARQTGRILYGGGGLRTTPVIDYRTYTDDREQGDIHMKVHQYSTRARMIAANGHADNHVMVVGGKWRFTDDEPDLRTLFRQMDNWLTRLSHDTSEGDSAARVVNAKPADLVDGCWDNREEPRKWIAEKQTFDGPGVCNELYPAYPTPRHVAGAPLANEIVKCQLKPVARDDYNVALSDSQFGRLQKAFPDGVCDWTEPGVHTGEHQGVWLSFWAVRGESSRTVANKFVAMFAGFSPLVDILRVPDHFVSVL
jgi:hypothetical protein